MLKADLVRWNGRPVQLVSLKKRKQLLENKAA